MRNKDKYPYEEYHKNINEIIYKKCTRHNDFFPDENEWIPCNDEYFYKNIKNSIDGLQPECKKCSIEKMKNWRNSNRERVNVYQRERNKLPEIKLIGKIHSQKQRDSGYRREWEQNNKDKTQEYSLQRRMHKTHEITNKEWEFCKSYFNFSCAYCGMTEEEHKVKYNEQLHKEHVDHSGSNGLENCVPSCKICNCSKHTATIEEWYNECNLNYTYVNLEKINKWIKEDYQNYCEQE